MENATRTPACHRVMAKVVVSMTEAEYTTWRRSRYYRADRTPMFVVGARRG